MKIKQSVDELAARPMDRRQFLASAGAVALALVGVTTVLKALEQQRHSAGSAYGSSAYGGPAKRP
ncbi:MAG TPA: hypothetical protein VLI05_01590 [Candidatus Saccharimonadia bacterium]|nr:hypothetical protein [Candidatus Saccharimonadia bacterium]